MIMRGSSEIGVPKIFAVTGVHLRWECVRIRNIALKGVRLDSGRLANHAHKVRKILDDGGFVNIHILASGGISYQVCSLDTLETSGEIFLSSHPRQLTAGGDNHHSHCPAAVPKRRSPPHVISDSSEAKASITPCKSLYVPGVSEACPMQTLFQSDS